MDGVAVIWRGAKVGVVAVAEGGPFNCKNLIDWFFLALFIFGDYTAINQNNL